MFAMYNINMIYQIKFKVIIITKYNVNIQYIVILDERKEGCIYKK